MIGALLLWKMGEEYKSDKGGATYVNEIWSFYGGKNLDQLDRKCEKMKYYVESRRKGMFYKQ
jgi:hypothetical protein